MDNKIIVDCPFDVACTPGGVYFTSSDFSPCYRDLWWKFSFSSLGWGYASSKLIGSGTGFVPSDADLVIIHKDSTTLPVLYQRGDMVLVSPNGAITNFQ